MRSKVLLATACVLLGAAAAHAQTITEGFDNIATLPGSGWFVQNNSQPVGPNGWFQGTAAFPAQSGAPTSYIGADFNSTTGRSTISNWLVMPAVTLVNGTRLTFYTRAIAITPGFSQFPDRLQVRMSLNGSSTNVGTGPTGLGDFTTLLLDINPTYATGAAGYPLTWTQFTVTVLTGLASPTVGRLAYRYFVEDGGPAGNNSDFIGIDTMTLTGPDLIFKDGFELV